MSRGVFLEADHVTQISIKQPGTEMHSTCRIVIAVLELGGGVVGLGVISFSVLSAGEVSYLAILPACLYLLCIVAGLALLRNRPNGIALSVLVQAIQIPQIVSGKFSFVFASGLAAWLQFGTAGVGYDYVLGSRFRVEFASGFGRGVAVHPVFVGINLVAGLALTYLICRLFVRPRD